MSQALRDSRHSAPRVLLHEQDAMLRQVFSLHVKSTGLAEVEQSTTARAARQKFASTEFQLVIIGFSEDNEEMSLIELIRGGLTICDESVPIIAMVSGCTAAQVQAFKSLDVTDVLVRPLRIRTIQDAVLRNIS